MISFESEDVQLQKLRERLGQMSDKELLEFGKLVRGLSAAPRIAILRDPWHVQLEEACEEWRRRHPKRSETPHTFRIMEEGLSVSEDRQVDGPMSLAATLLRRLIRKI
jgi:hypothetical protein